MKETIRPLVWIGSSRKDLRAMPEEVQATFGYALFLAQIGKKHAQAKPLKGFGSADVLEVVENADDGAYRAVYTIRLGKIPSTSCIAFKRNQPTASPRRSQTWT